MLLKLIAFKGGFMEIQLYWCISCHQGYPDLFVFPWNLSSLEDHLYHKGMSTKWYYSSFSLGLVGISAIQMRATGERKALHIVLEYRHLVSGAHLKILHYSYEISFMLVKQLTLVLLIPCCASAKHCAA